MGRTNLNFPNLETFQRSSAHIQNFEFVFTAKTEHGTSKFEKGLPKIPELQTEFDFNQH